MFNFKKSNYLINAEANQCLETILRSKILTNAYIFYGAEGVGKKNSAFKFIKEIFKQYSSSANLEERITNNNHPDFLLIEPTSLVKAKKTKNTANGISKNNNAEIIKIDEIRNVKTFLSQKSIESEKKIVLIIDARLLNESASNCLLKTLEEPTNGIFILLTSKLNALLDTIKSRCQLIRFKSFSRAEIETFIKNDSDSTNLEILEELNFQDLVNSSNGSPKEVLKNIQIWNELSDEIKRKLNLPMKDNLRIFEVAKLITEELDISKQIGLINLLQQIWWRKTKDSNLIRKLENLKLLIKNNVQPRLAWEVTLFRITNQNLIY